MTPKGPVCPKCGNHLVENMQRCPSCGHIFEYLAREIAGFVLPQIGMSASLSSSGKKG
jgi:predicted nucleic-acid-binding Zn-ribbon protein